MPALFTLGRILFAILFIVAGGSKLADIATTTQMISGKIALPAQLMPYVSQLEAASGMAIGQLMAIASGVIEVAGGLLIAIGFGARAVAWLLILFIVAATYYFHDFWNMTGADKTTNMFQALKNLSLIGGLLMISGAPSAIVQSNESRYDDRV